MRFPRKIKKKCKIYVEKKHGSKARMIKNSTKRFEDCGWTFRVQLLKHGQCLKRN